MNRGWNRQEETPAPIGSEAIRIVQVPGGLLLLGCGGFALAVLHGAKRLGSRRR